MNKKKLGKLGELFAKHYLILRGYQILYMNYLVNRYGEIDIIAIKEAKLEFIEVKTRTNNSKKMFGKAKDSIDYKKLQSMRKAINYFLTHDGKNYSYYNKKISVITIEVDYFRVD